MKPSQLKSFVRDWLAVRDLEAEQLHPDVWKIGVPSEIRQKIGRKELVLAFTQKGRARHPRSELATIGNPLFDRLLGVAREEGRIGIGFQKPPAKRKRMPAKERAGAVDGMFPKKGERIYQAVYHLVFTVSYPSIEAADEMEVVSVDGADLDVLTQIPDLVDAWSRMDERPRKGHAVIPPFPIPKRVMETGLRALEKRMRRRINKVRQESERHLDRETASIEAYYQQLIEEARNQSRRWSSRREEKEDRIRWLQLEWKRRIEEAKEFWRPQVNARLVAIGAQMLPRVGYRYPVPKTKGSRKDRSVKGPMKFWDEATGEFLAPYCEISGRTGLEEPVITADGRFAHPDVPHLALVPAKEPDGNGGAEPDGGSA
ncbi:MAG: hypothetical protein GF346_05415 [Candidatus Eisenbacteria bacterium]|nr:hypothetical protein [Candidatus Latescibacterota bacterium]MBD3301866.1 hypothetical protein [Candidatus Eisenbacteria bacterium]